MPQNLAIAMRKSKFYEDTHSVIDRGLVHYNVTIADLSAKVENNVAGETTLDNHGVDLQNKRRQTLADFC